MPDNRFDLIVVGGGISGLGVAYRAAAKGLRTLLLESGTFGGKTSSASLRIMHGGFRYLQTLNIRRVVESIRAQSELLNKFPEYVSPLSCVMPLSRSGLKSKYPVQAALASYSLLCRIVRGSGHPGAVLTAQQVLEQVPLLSGKAEAGALLWTDAILSDHEGLVKALVAGIVSKGSEVRVSCKVTAVARDTGGFEVNSKQGTFASQRLVNASGAWIESVRPRGEVLPHYPSWCRAFNLILSKQLHPSHGVAVQSKDGRLYFTVPRGAGGVLGTEYLSLLTDASESKITEEEIVAFLNRYNEALPNAGLSLNDIVGVEHGILPLVGSSPYSLRGRAEISVRANYAEILSTKYTTFLLQADDALGALGVV